MEGVATLSTCVIQNSQKDRFVSLYLQNYCMLKTDIKKVEQLNTVILSIAQNNQGRGHRENQPAQPYLSVSR
jgi:hypothetical protein